MHTDVSTEAGEPGKAGKHTSSRNDSNLALDID
jgi:hypothetical protein